jgi:hypothetical protein
MESYSVLKFIDLTYSTADQKIAPPSKAAQSSNLTKINNISFSVGFCHQQSIIQAIPIS